MQVVCDTLPPVQWLPPDRFDPEHLTIFKIAVGELAGAQPYLTSLLQAEERQRISAYHRPVNRQRFLVARAGLRIILSKYTGQLPHELQLAASKNGKPGLAAFPALHYNVSHTNGYSLIAVFKREVGIDVEAVDPGFMFAEIVEHSFGEPEREGMQQAAPTARNLFYQLWTRKEALVKATGQGIGADFHTIPSLDGCHYPAGRPADASQRWLVRSFWVDAATLAAMAYAASEPPARIRFYEMSETLLVSS